MSEASYKARPYRPGDEGAINELYRRVTGRVRSVAQWRWQWQKAPGGTADIWLIEAIHPDGGVELIGHHGIMPVRFTWGDRDLLFGKTENTMVLPEHRRKILYPRFEKRFAESYEARYDALFSTTGPAAALRQRKANGYSTDHAWNTLEHGPGLVGSCAMVANHLGGTWRQLAKLLQPLRGSRGNRMARFQRLLATEALRNPFVGQYWNHARRSFGIAPSRAAEDLAWRFWENPYVQPDAFFMDDALGAGLAVVDTSNPACTQILDWSFVPAREGAEVDAMRSLTEQLSMTCRSRFITFDSTDDGMAPALAGLFRTPWIRRLRPLPADRLMPRKVTKRGRDRGLTPSGWNVTPILFEGR